MFENEIELEDETFDTIAQRKAKIRKNWPSTSLDDLQNEEEQWLDSFVHEL